MPPGGSKITSDLVIRRLTPELWPAIGDLFDTRGPAGRCWCMYWRIGGEYRRRDPDANRAAFREIVETGPPPGLVALDGPTAVGWCQLTPRPALPWLERRHARIKDDAPVWSISCFYVRKGYRRQGVASALIDAAVATAKRAGAVAVEAYPVDADRTSTTSHTGHATAFRRAGFATVAGDQTARPVMRLHL